MRAYVYVKGSTDQSKGGVKISDGHPVGLLSVEGGVRYKPSIRYLYCLLSGVGVKVEHHVL